VVGASLRGEVPLEVVQVLAGKRSRVALDVQGFVRVACQGRLAYRAWPQQEDVLALVDILKTDAVEAEMLTGKADMRQAAEILADLGPAEVVLTHKEGLLVCAHGEFHEAGFFPAELVGRSGRGDTCLAAYACKRLEAPPGAATVWAAAVTSLKMEAEGPFRREIPDVEMLISQRYCGTQ
jgi:sugar/nucleoside kinase (ribokinase family)